MSEPMHPEVVVVVVVVVVVAVAVAVAVGVVVVVVFFLQSPLRARSTQNNDNSAFPVAIHVALHKTTTVTHFL